MNSYYVLTFSLLFGISVAATFPKCQDDSQCAPNECCQILSEFLIASRRDLLSLLATPAPREGSCHPYKNEGDFCDIFARPNGYCSCAPGQNCHGEEVLVATKSPLVRSVRDMRPSRPGYHWEYKCTKV